MAHDQFLVLERGEDALSVKIFASILDVDAFLNCFIHLNTIDVINIGFLAICYWNGMHRSEIHFNFSHQFGICSGLQPTGIGLCFFDTGVFLEHSTSRIKKTGSRCHIGLCIGTCQKIAF